MTSANTGSASPASDRWEQCRNRFRTACRSQRPPPIPAIPDWAQTFPAEEQPDLLVDLVTEHLRCAWEAGRRPLLEDYVRDLGSTYGEFASVATLPVDLIEGEFLARHEFPVLSDHPSLEKYEQRFPGRTDVRQRLQDCCLGGGRYVRVRFIGAGGLGSVWEAYDRHLDRYVAIKSPRWELSERPRIQARLQREARLTAGLEHPAIVTVHELCSADGTAPLYVMRLVHGRRLDEIVRDYHDHLLTRNPSEQRLRWNELLRHFIAVCDAMRYAHSRGVIHRDLKPQNIVVGEFGETIVVDWGLAQKAGAGPAPSEIEGERTTDPFASVADGPAGTLAYMSPEQARGEASVRSDIFSLGGILYAILTGHSPYFADEGEGARDLRLRIEEARYRLPRQLQPKAPRDLQFVCLKAMDRDPLKRYGAASELGQDVARFLADEPVSARAEPFPRRALRWARRNRTIVTAAVAMGLVALVGTAAVLAVQTQSNRALMKSNDALGAANEQATRANENLQAAIAQLERARTRAEDHFALALRAVEHFHRSVSQNLDVKNRPELKRLRQDLLQAPLEFYGQLEQELQNDMETEPAAAGRYAEAVLGLAQITAMIGSEPDAVAAYRHAIEVLDRLDRRQPASTRYRPVLARAHLNLAALLRVMTQTPDALASGERARVLFQGLVTDHSSEEDFLFGLAESENLLGLLHRESRRPVEALTDFETSRDRLQALVRDHPATVAYQAELALVLSNIGVAQHAAGRNEDARRNYEQSIATFQPLVRDHPETVLYRSGLAKAAFNLGSLYGIDLEQGRLAFANLEQARTLQQALVQENPTVGEYRAELAKTSGQIAAFQRYSEPAKSLENFRQTRDLLQGLVHDHPDVTKYRADLALTDLHISDRLLFFQRFEEALVSLEAARVLCETLVLEAPNDYKMKHQLGDALRSRGVALEGLHRYEEAVDSYRRAIPRLRSAYNQAPANLVIRRTLLMDLVLDYEKLAGTFRTLNRPHESLQWLGAAFDGLDELAAANWGAGDHIKLAEIYSQVIDLVNQERHRLSPSDRAQGAMYSDRAMVLLRGSVAAGAIQLEQFQQERRFDPLRQRADFQALMMDLAFPSNPFGP